jgi:hypothetical protein
LPLTLLEAAQWIITARRYPDTPMRATAKCRLAWVQRHAADEFGTIRRNARRDFLHQHHRQPTADELEDAILRRIGLQPTPAAPPPRRA